MNRIKQMTKNMLFPYSATIQLYIMVRSFYSFVNFGYILVLRVSSLSIHNELLFNLTCKGTHEKVSDTWIDRYT